MAKGRQRVLVVTGGHRFDRPAFDALWNSLPGIDWTEAKHPAAQACLSPEGTAEFGCIVFYDIPGIRFLRHGAPEFEAPSPALQAGFEGLIATGKPLLFLHHAMAGWPTWDRYAEIIGARFFYQTGAYKGRAQGDSGYCPDARYTARPVAAHPVTQGLEGGFDLCDELYSFQLLEPEIIPLLAIQHKESNISYLSAAAALRGQAALTGAQNGTNLIAWARRVGRAPVVVIQPGDTAQTFANPGYRHLIGNALHWLPSADAATWAAEQESPA